MVFNETGHTQALYHKHFLFETEAYVFFAWFVGAYEEGVKPCE